MNEKKALKILFDKYWAPSSGWQRSELTASDFEFAKEAGVMFDDVVMGHDEVVSKAYDAIQKAKKEQVVNAFISSLSTRRLDHRSALGSYASGKNMPLHTFDNARVECSKSCDVCAEYPRKDKIDLNVLNFERHKFGGVRHLFPVYIWLDLWLFDRVEELIPSEEDVKILANALDALKSIKGNKLSDAQKALQGIFKANKNEREHFVAVMGYCGILKIPNYRPFYVSYIPSRDREQSNYSKSDWPFPSDLWRPEFGLDDASLEFWFGGYSS